MHLLVAVCCTSCMPQNMCCLAAVCGDRVLTVSSIARCCLDLLHFSFVLHHIMMAASSALHGEAVQLRLWCYVTLYCTSTTI
jgi:hypothetical protein